MHPTVFWAPTGHNHQGVNIAGTPHRGTSPHNVNAACNAAIGQHLVSALQQLTQSSPLSMRWATVFKQSMLPSHSISPQRLSWANTALMQPAHGCTVHLHKRIGHSPQATSSTARQSLCLNICRHSVSAP
jgi:hypothetical protein